MSKTGMLVAILLIVAAWPAFADRSGSFEEDGKTIDFRLPGNYCLVEEDHPQAGDFLWTVARTSIPAIGDLMAVGMDCENLEAIEREDLGGSADMNGFRLVAVIVLDENPGGTQEGLITGIAENYDAGEFSGVEVSLVGTDEYGVYIQVALENDGLVTVGGITMVDGVVVDVEFVAYDQGSLTRGRLYSDARETMRHLVLNNGTQADIDGHDAFDLGTLGFVFGGMGLVVFVGALIIWRRQTSPSSPGDDVWDDDRESIPQRSANAPVKRSGFGRRNKGP